MAIVAPTLATSTKQPSTIRSGRDYSTIFTAWARLLGPVWAAASRRAVQFLADAAARCPCPAAWAARYPDPASVAAASRRAARFPADAVARCPGPAAWAAAVFQFLAAWAARYPGPA